jgi:hypothetical protein
MHKNIIFISTILSILCSIVQAQVPNQFNYQAVARNSIGQGIPNANIRTRFTILDGSASGTNVYSEVRQLTTNQLGLFTAAIGSAGANNVTGNFATIDWSTGKKFIKVEVDPLGGTNFLALGNTEMLSVPYALYAVNGRVGPQGPPNVLNVGTVVTGATGTPASATITGTSPTQTINLVLPTGANGKISLVKTTTEAAGVNCAVGGTKIEAGVDINSNNTLDASEVTNISYVCNGDVNNTWKTIGNAASASDFIGTTNGNPLVFKQAGFESMRINSSGNVGIRNAGLTDASLFVNRAGNINGSAQFQGSVYPSTFQQGANEDTYIRGGKAGSRVYINDVANTTTQIGWPALVPSSSSLKVNGSVSYSTKYVNNNYTLTDNDYILYCDLENDGNRVINVTLPTPSTIREGRVYTILVLNAPTVSPGDAQANKGVVAIYGTHGYQPIFNHWNSGWGTNQHKLFYIEQTCFLCQYMRWYRTSLSYICVNNKWQKLSDNEVICDEDI